MFCCIELTDGRLVSGSYDSTLKIWDTISGSCLMTLKGSGDNNLNYGIQSRVVA